MTTALYRRYRPESFGEMIGQSQVTEPLMTALRGDRVGHAYLFSGPRGCGKTTSARILARCLNCAQGPTDTPCGTCDSCVELSRGGGGSLDVVEIDAASHNGVDDARDLRERAVFAPARDRFKIFILDEAHMVTAQGFNALLKLVEEPPAHVKFIFATTEPEKVIGTIRSRTHHYPFRLVAPAAMLEYVEQLCTAENVSVEPGVLPLVVRAGGGSPRDTLSLLDQLIAGSDDGVVGYERAVALLGYTHGELLDEVVEAFARHDAGAAFAAVDRVVQTGQDPRRFVDDLLERLRDLIIVSATGAGASAVLRGVPVDELERMGVQASAFGTDRLSRVADIVVTALDDMSGATSPRLQLELLVARVLASAAPAPLVSAAPSAAPAQVAVPVTPSAAPAAQVSTPVAASSAASPAPAVPVSAPPGAASPAPEAAPVADAVPAAPAVPSGPLALSDVVAAWPRVLAALEPVSRSSWMLASAAHPVAFAGDVLTLAFHSASDVTSFKKLAGGKGPSEDLRGAIVQVLGVRVKYVARHDPSIGGLGGLGDPGGSDGAAASGDADAEGASGPSPETAPDGNRRDAPAAPRPGVPTASAAPRPAPARAPEPTRSAPVASAAAAPVTEWAVAPIPGGDAAPAPLAVDEEPEDAAAPASVRTLTREHDGDVLTDADAPMTAEEEEELPPPVIADAPLPPRAPVAVERPIERAAPARTSRPGGIERVGEAVVRQILGATFVREEPYTPPARFQ
ncbi:MAG: DNA polymerase III subunit gamma and tau [Candidatus Microbacterium phytovorans]|uniref:DNA polymerase III subunit gamma/tau n=1 Tax=Candidatus Microbacterium phytovorans TaxID=3121374 RepID=A0AAJ6B1M6_9MICO|nr:DNA polymerase III subunit gamma and tau [Microbacterium sp.]WEK12393.1 MAG: DNA polymerase III subunit gamma and tau [Microbacterium sp.]